MAKRIINNKNIAVIELSIAEARDVNLGPICDHCNDALILSKANVLYVPVLNHLMCKKCYNEWINKPSTRHYPEDEHFEKVHYNYYAEKLNLETI